LGKQHPQLFKIVLSKIAYGSKIRLLPGGQKNEGNVLFERLGNLSGTEYAFWHMNKGKS